MKQDEFRKIVKYLGGLFPTQITQEQARFLRDQIIGLKYESVVEAVKNHRRSHEFIHYPQLLEGCRAVERGGMDGSNPSEREESWVDIQRRMNPRFANVSPLEIVLRVHRGWWHYSGRTDGARRAVESSCRGRLIGLGMPNDKTAPWIAAVFDPGVEFFRRVLAEAADAGCVTPAASDARGVVDFARAELGGEFASEETTATVALVQKFSLAWAAAKATCVDETSLCRARCVIHSHAKNALVEEAKQSAGESEEMARDIVELAPGERMARPDPLAFRRPATDGPRDNRDKELLRLAVAAQIDAPAATA